MKNYILLPILLISMTLSAQKDFYTAAFKKEKYTSQRVEIIMSDNEINPPGSVAGFSALSIIPTVIDVGIRGITAYLEKREKKFTSEVSGKATNVILNNTPYPNLEFHHDLFRNEDKIDALNFKMKAVFPAGFQDGFYYSIENLSLNASLAKVGRSTSKNRLDLTIKVSLTCLVDGEKKVQELSPIQINGLTFGTHSLDGKSAYGTYNTDLVLLPEDSKVTEVSITVVESNPHKVKSESILALWNNNKDDIKTIINNFLPESSGESSEEATGVDPNSSSASTPVN